jgi:sugar phosphate isomerase/epimerase
MIRAFSNLAKTVNEAGCRLALYNYGSWFGAVDVQLEIIAGVRERTGVEIGTVFNFHRGHQHMKDFPEALERMRPHLMAVNLNGMNLADAGTTEGNAKILPLGEGDHELTMMKQLLDSGYNGPIGIIDHRDGVDAEQALRANLEGLKKLRSELLQSKAGQ